MSNKSVILPFHHHHSEKGHPKNKLLDDEIPFANQLYPVIKVHKIICNKNCYIFLNKRILIKVHASL